MSLADTFTQVGAEVLKLRRHRTTMLTATVLSIAITFLYIAVILARGEGSIGGAQVLSSGSTLLAMYFGSFTAMLIGTVAGTSDLDHGVLRDLIATGCSRTRLFLVRVPAAVGVALAFNLLGFAVTAASAMRIDGGGPTPTTADIALFGSWVVLATAVVTCLSLGVASLTGSRSLTLTAVIGWQTIATTLLYGMDALGALREGLLFVALTHLRPGPAIGAPGRPGSSNALPGFVLPTSATVAVLVLLAWTLVPLVLGAWRLRNQDA